MSFRTEADAAALAWKQATPLLPDAAREPGLSKRNTALNTCLPREFAGLNLLPEARDAIARI